MTRRERVNDNYMNLTSGGSKRNSNAVAKISNTSPNKSQNRGATKYQFTFEYQIAEISERIFTFTELSEKRIGSMHPRNMHLR